MAEAKVYQPAGPFARLGSFELSPYAWRVVILTGVGLALRVLWLGHEPIWRDEAFTAIVQQRSVGAMVDAVRNDSAPPLSYLLTHIFVVLFGATPPALRVTSAIAGTVMVPVGAALARRCAGDHGGLWAAVLCALAPSLVMSGRDARMYAMATTLVTLSALTLWRASEHSTRLRWSLYGLAVLLALYTQYFAILAIPAQLVALRFVLRASWRTVATAAAMSTAAVVAMVPWLIYAAPQFRHAEVPFWVQPISTRSVGGMLTQFFSGPPIELGTQGKTLLQAVQVAAVVAGYVVVFLLIRNRKTLGAPGLYLALCGVGPIVLLAAVSVWHPLFESRYASVVWGPLFALLGAGIGALNRVRLQILVAAVLVAPTIGYCLTVTHPDTPALVAYVEPRLHQYDFVESDPGDYLLLLYYGDANLRAHTQIVRKQVSWFWGISAFPPGAVTPVVPSSTIQNRGVIYWVNDNGHTLPPQPAGYVMQRQDCFSTICVTTYASGPG